MRFASLALLLAATALSSTPLRAQNADAPAKPAPRGATPTHEEIAKSEAEAAWSNAPVEEQAVTTAHSITAGGKALKYHATAGTLTLRTQDGKPDASMFYTAYTLDGSAPGSKRPITFLYNGGPGSPTFWLHMGSFGPMRLVTGNPEYIKPAPYAFGPNADTLLDKTDLVFLDAIGAGFSRPLGDTKPSEFYSVDGDADAFARAVMRYITKFGRWGSPKYLLGESYGTLRSGALAYQLQDRGVALNGVILLSSIMNYGYRQPGLDQVYINYLPSYAATAWYHNRLQNRPADVADIVAQARAFAVGPYASALAKGQTIGAEERAAVARQMSALTGLSVDFLIRSNLRVELSRFRKEILRDQRQTVGRYDSRYTGIDTDAAGDAPETDASDTSIAGAFIATFNDYVRNDLGYKTDLPYRLSASDGAGWGWDWKHRAPGRGGQPQNNPNTAMDLAAAMRENPYLRVLSLNGYYDMATPFFGTEFDLNHMMLEPARQPNLGFRYYPAGHMTYLNPDALHMLRTDLAAFYDSAP